MMSSNYQSSHQPTAEQLARDEALKRFNQRNVLLPVVIAVLIALALLITLVVLAFLPNNGAVRQFISGMADLVIILASLPMILLCAILPVAYLALMLNRRQQRRLSPQYGPMAYRGRLQTALWWVQNKLDQLQVAVESGSYKVAEQVMKAHERFEYQATLLQRLRRRFGRSNQ